jgi:acyl carrier protein
MKQDEALSWIANLFEEDVENVKPETTQEEIHGWDSLGIMNLMADLDADFDIYLEEDEIVGLKKVSDILDVLKKHGKLE